MTTELKPEQITRREGEARLVLAAGRPGALCGRKKWAHGGRCGCSRDRKSEMTWRSWDRPCRSCWSFVISLFILSSSEIIQQFSAWVWVGGIMWSGSCSDVRIFWGYRVGTAMCVSVGGGGGGHVELDQVRGYYNSQRERWWWARLDWW